MAAGVFGYLGYDMVRLMEELPAANPDPIGIPDAILIRPTSIVVFDAVKDEITVVTPVRPEPGVTAKAALRARGRAARRRGRRARPAARQGSRRGPSPARSTMPAQSEHHAGRIPAHGRSGPRTTSPPATSSRWCCRSASRRRSRCRRSRSTARCAASTPRRSCTSSISAASRSSARAPRSWCGVRDGTVTDPPDRRHPAARRDAARGQGAGGRTARRSEGARRAPDAARPRPQRRRPRRRDRHASKVTEQFFIERYSHVMHIVSNVEGTLADGLRRARRAGRGLPGRHRLRRAEGAGDGDHRRAGEGEARRSMPAASAISPPTARWTPASCCAPRWSRTAPCMCRPAPASSPTPIRRAEQPECVNKAKALFRAAEEARRFASAAGRGQ